MRLVCALVGVKESVFSVTIDPSMLVDELKKAIKKEKKNNLKAVDADELQLFLARKGDETWLPSNDPLAQRLRDGNADDADIKKMIGGEEVDPTWTIQEWLDENKMTGRRHVPKSKQIHVLVVVPDGATSGMYAAPKLLTAEQTKMVVNEVLKERDEMASVYSFSDLNAAMEMRIVKKMRLTESIPDVKEPVDTSIAGYSWIPKITESEESQRAGYMAYLQQHLKPLMDRGNFLLDDIAGDKSVLSIVDPRLPFAMKGTADVLLINRTSKNPLIKLAGVSMVIELKKKVEPGHVPQAVGQLVSCSMKAPLNCYPLSLLTDLNDHWHFSWFSDKHVLTQVTLQYPRNAFKFIEAAVLERTESRPFPLSFIPGPFKTIKVDDFLPQLDDGRAEEMMERYELMADVVEPEFLMARRMEYAQHLVQSMPMYAHMYA